MKQKFIFYVISPKHNAYLNVNLYMSHDVYHIRYKDI